MEVITLTHEQEKRILNYVLTLELEDAGAARMVFPLNKMLQADLGIDPNEDCIVKVPMGIGGYRQTQLEIQTYLTYGSNWPLARLIRYGHFIEIMERVEVDDFRGFYDEYGDAEGYADYIVGSQKEDESEEDYRTRYDKAYADAEEAMSVMEQLSDIFGSTDDNGQLGWTKNRRLVAYDYGYTTDASTSEQVSDISDNVYDDETRDDYIGGLIDLLGQEENMLEHYEKVFLNDENGDGTYTRYELVGLMHNAEDMKQYYNNQEYRKIFDEAKTIEDLNDNITYYEDSLKAYIIYEVTYDIDNNEKHRQTVEVNIDDEYKEIWYNTKEN